MEDHCPSPSIQIDWLSTAAQEETIMTEAAVERLRAVHAILDAGFGQLGREEALCELLQRACTVLSADAGIIFLRDETSKQFVARASCGCVARGGSAPLSEDGFVGLTRPV